MSQFTALMVFQKELMDYTDTVALERKNQQRRNRNSNLNSKFLICCNGDTMKSVWMNPDNSIYSKFSQSKTTKKQDSLNINLSYPKRRHG